MNNDIIELLNIKGIDVDLESSTVTRQNGSLLCYLKLIKKDEKCPVCGSRTIVTKDYRDKKITHSISTVSPCFIVYRARRFICKNCGKLFYEHNPFALPDEKVTTLTKILVLDYLRSHTETFSAAAKLFNLSTTSVINIFDNYVDMKALPLPNVICIDEIYTNRLCSTSKYTCIIADFYTNSIVEMYRSRHKLYLTACFNRIPANQRDKVCAVVMDMWDSYRDLAHVYFKNAIVAVDSFHIIMHINDALTQIRINIMNKYKKNVSSFVEHDMYYYMLKKFHYFFTKDFDKITEKPIRIYKLRTKWDKYEIRKYLLSIHPDLYYAYWLKEDYREFNRTAYYESCDEELDEFIDKFSNSHLKEYRDVGKMLQRWKTEIKNSFIRVSNKRLSNGSIEGINSKLRCIIKNANGYCNWERFRNRCMFCINKKAPIKGMTKSKINY